MVTCFYKKPLIGLNICFFTLDVIKKLFLIGVIYNLFFFSPINLTGLSEQHLRSMGVKPIVEYTGSDDIIQVIP
jgi:hypothetical protein